MTTATMTSKGQITIPQSIREALGLKAGVRIDFVKRDDGHITMIPATKSIKDLKGIIPKRSKTLTIEDMNAIIAFRASQAR